MSLKTNVNATVFKPPCLVFTVHNDNGQKNPGAVNVLEQLAAWTSGDQGKPWPGCDIRVFGHVDEVEAAFANGHDPDRAVALFDQGGVRRHFTPVTPFRHGNKLPEWALGTKWGIACGRPLSDVDAPHRALNCAQQVQADFQRRFEENVDAGHYPWGLRRQGEKPPMRVELPPETQAILKRLNEGPDMVASLHPDHRESVPRGANISWIRVPGALAEYPRRKMKEAVDSVAAFERASAELVRQVPEVRETLMAGVVLDPSHPELRECYLFPRNGDREVMSWSVRRPDMHVCGTELLASENDEMPGGFPGACHVDHAYEINLEGWQRCFEWLCSRGPLVFMVSDGWSAPYVDSTKWLAGFMRERGHDARVLTTSELDRVEVGEGEVLVDGMPVGKIWRQFPVFETRGKLAELVMASQRGAVRMVPEFAHFGNKSWFSLFRQHEGFFRETLGEERFAIIDGIVPRSRLVRHVDGDFPLTIGGKRLYTMADLRDLDGAARERLVLKVTGANDLAARSYGVFMGNARSQEDWKAWIAARQRNREPFIAQERFETSVETLAVWNLRTRAPELFRCRVLLRPWCYGEGDDVILLTSHNACTPSYTTKVHGMADMAVQPVVYV